jgi:hypothetical protein
MKKVVTFSLAMLLATLILVPPALSSDPTFSFNLVGPQTAENPTNGETIQVTGGGSFDSVSPGNVVGGGTFTIFNGSTVIGHGTWKATAFDSFTPFGGPRNGFQGGTLSITVTLFFDGGSPLTNVPMTVNCLIDAPPSFTGSEGVAVGDFTDILAVRGHTLFHEN